MSLTSLMDENGPRGIDVARWTGSLCLVLLLHASVSLAILDNIEPPDSPAERESIMMIELPVEAILPQAESVASVAADAAEEVETAEIVETAEPLPQEVVEETAEVTEEAPVEPIPEEKIEVTQETPVEQVPEEKVEVAQETPAEQVPEAKTEAVEEVKPTEVSETALVVAEIVPPTETVEAKPVELPEPPKPRPKPEPKPKPKPKPKTQKASTASVNSQAAAGAGRSNPKVLSRYLSQVRASIMRHRRSVSGASGRVVVSVTISKSGGLSGIRIARSSGNSALDRAALGIVQSVGKVAPIPAETGRSSIPLSVPFTFAR